MRGVVVVKAVMPRRTRWRGRSRTLRRSSSRLADGQPPTKRLAGITQPTLVATGAAGQEAGAPAWAVALDDAADAIAASMPHAIRQRFEGQSHVADPAVIASALTRFFAG